MGHFKIGEIVKEAHGDNTPARIIEVINHLDSTFYKIQFIEKGKLKKTILPYFRLIKK